MFYQTSISLLNKQHFLSFFSETLLKFLVAFLEPRKGLLPPAPFPRSEGVCLTCFDKNFQFHNIVFMKIKEGWSLLCPWKCGLLI